MPVAAAGQAGLRAHVSWDHFPGTFHENTTQCAKDPQLPFEDDALGHKSATEGHKLKQLQDQDRFWLPVTLV